MMARCKRIIFVGLVVLLSAKAGWAADKVVVVEPIKMRIASLQFATCIVSKKRLKAIAIRFLLNGQESDGEKIAQSECFITATLDNGINPDGLSASWKMGAFRSLIANGLLRTDFNDQGPNDFSSVAPLEELQAAEDEFPSQQLLETARLLSKLGECATRHDPEAVRRMAQTQPRSDEELASLQNLVPSFGRCMHEGVSLKLTRDVMRDYSILAYARMAYTLQSTSAASNVLEMNN